VDIGAWLHTLRLSQYAQAFRDNDVDLEILLELTAEDLASLGVVSVGHRRKLLTAIAALRRDPAKLPTAEPSSATREPSGAERRQLTVMFVDLVGSTELSRRLDPEEMNGLIRSYQNTVTGEVARFEGQVAKLMGDGVLCYFGWPRAHEDDAERAVRAGLAVTQAVGDLRVPSNSCLSTRIGIATGLVVVGELVGTGVARERAVAGETPNLAARLQTAADPGEMLVAESTRRLLGELFVFSDRGTLALKGYDQPVRTFAVLGGGAGESRFGALHGAGLTPLVGRERELGLLLDAWARAATGEGQVALLIGEPGIGKSRLIDTFKSRLAGSPHARLEYQSSPLHTQSALHPFAGELAWAAGLHREDRPGERRRKLDAFLVERVGHDAAATVGPPLASLLGLSTDGQLSPDLTPQQLKAKKFAALIAQVRGLGSRGPLLLVFEDAHWADPTSLELLAALVERVAGLPALMVVSHRPEFSPGWGDLPHVVPINLQRLNRREAAALAERVAGVGKLQPATIEQLVPRADGVPLFIEELVRAFLERRVREKTKAGAPGAEFTPAEEVPSTLHDLLCARLDGLGPAKEVLQIGAAIGREFSRELVAAA
jgi:class 3 adenylate cyclase